MIFLLLWAFFYALKLALLWVIAGLLLTYLPICALLAYLHVRRPLS